MKPEEVGGYVQAIRDSMLQNEVSKRVPATVDSKKPPVALTKKVEAGEKTANVIAEAETDKKTMNTKENEEPSDLGWKPKGKMAWKPKAIASGATPLTSAPTLMGQGVVHKFGSDKDCSPEHAMQMASQRAVELQEELYPQNT